MWGKTEQADFCAIIICSATSDSPLYKWTSIDSSNSQMYNLSGICPVYDSLRGPYYGGENVHSTRETDDHQSFDNIENTRVEEAGLVGLRILRIPCAFCLFIVSGSD